MAREGLEHSPSRRPWWGRVGLVLAAVTTAIAMFALRVVWAGESEMRASNAALVAGDAEGATRAARRAASWYAPGAPHVGAAYARLIALARGAEAVHQPKLARFAWQGVRTAALDSRWLVQPRKEELALANRSLARLNARQLHGGRTPDPGVVRAQLAALQRNESPRVHWVVVLVMAFAMALVGFGNVARHSGGAAGEVRLGLAKRNLFVAVMGVMLWLIAVWRA